MASKYTQTSWRGVGLLDPRWSFSNFATSSSTATQDGAEADQPITSGGRGSFVQFEARGNVTTDATLLDVKAIKEGLSTGNAPGGRFIWKDEGDTDLQWKGWLSPNKLTHFSWFKFKDMSDYPATTTGGYQAAHGLRTPGHRAVVVWDDQETDKIMCSYRDSVASSWTDSTVYTKSAAWHGHPTVVRLGGGRLLCFYMLKSLAQGAVKYFTVGMSFSDDDGATWTVGGEHIDGIRINAYVSAAILYRLRAVVVNDVITMVIGYDTSLTAGYGMDHFVSNDLGSSFQAITETSDSAGHTMGEYGSWDLVATPDGSVVWVGVERNGDGQTLRRFRKTSPYQPFKDDPDGAGSALLENVDTAQPLSVAACVDDHGWLWVLARRHTGQPRSRWQLVKLHSDTLVKVSASSTPRDEHLHSGFGAANAAANEPVDFGNDDSTSITMPCLFAWKSHLVCLANHLAQSNSKKSLMELHFGGYSSVDWQYQTYGFHNHGSGSRHGMVYLPIESPNTIAGWTVTTSGTAPTPSITADGLVLPATAGTYRVNRSGSTVGNPSLTWIRIRLTSATNFSLDDCAAMIQVGDGTTGYRVTVRFSNHGARLYDNIGTANVGADITGLNTAIAHDYLISVEGGRAAVWYKDAILDEEWTLGPAGPISSTSGILNSIDWGHRSNASSSFTGASNWRVVATSMDGVADETGWAAGIGSSNSDELKGRPLSTRWQYLTRGVMARSVGSAAYRNDSYQIPTRYARGVHLLDPALHPSPAVKWSAKNDSAQQELVYQLQGNEPAGFLSSSICVFISRPNFRMAYLDGWTGSAWVTLATVDSADQLNGLSYTRIGSEITVNVGVSQTANRFVEMDELVRGYAVFSGQAHEIARNTDGVWASTDQRRLVVTLLGDVSGISGTGTVDLIAPQVAVVKHNLNTSYSKYRIRIPACVTAEDKIQAGTMLVGPMAFFGQDPDWGSVTGLDPNVEISEARDGSRMVARRGNERRRVEISWPNGWDMSDLYSANPDPAFIVARDAGGYSGVGVQGDATIVDGVLRRSAGGRYPVVYFPRMEPATPSSDQSTYTGNRVLYGRVMSGVTRQVLVGDEYSNEIVSVGTVTIEEEI
jgi:hypothetical protein